MTTISVFEIAAVQELRQRAMAASTVQQRAPEGWSKSRTDPMKLLAVFPSLSLRAGFVLRAYQFQDGGNGNGVVWAMPDQLPFPEPEDCPKLEGVFLEPPKPPGALDDLRSALEGDRSPWSYLSASIFAREAAEFGAQWHGVSWSDHALLGIDPLGASVESGHHNALGEVSRDPAAWRWRGKRPAEWRPSVAVARGTLTVTFFTFSGLERETIYRHVDKYKTGRYVFRTSTTRIATGPHGYIH